MSRFGELFLLCGFALAQPMFALLAPYPAFFAAHDVGRTEIAVLVVVLSFAAPLLGAGFAALARSRGAAVYAGSVGLLLTMMALQSLATLATNSPKAVLIVSLSAAFGVAGATGVLRSARLRGGLRFVAPIALVFPALFLFSPTVQSILATPEDAEFTGPTIESETSIVLILFDEFPLASLMEPAGGIDSERFPSFAELARGAHWFRNATTVADTTSFAVAGMLTGNRPSRTRPPNAATYPRNLFSLLANGRGLRIYEKATRLCPGWVCGELDPRPPAARRIAELLSDSAVLLAHRVTPRVWTRSLPDVQTRWKGFAETPASRAELPTPALPFEDPERHAALLAELEMKHIDVFAEAVRAWHAGERPTLLYAHAMLPHGLWQFYPSGLRYQPVTLPVGVVDGRRGGDEWMSVQALQRHLLQAAYADRVLGLLIEELRELDLYDDAMLVVAADHGHSFRQGTFPRRLSDDNFADVLSIPLFIKRPGQTGGVIDDSNAELIDLLPTIAAELEIEVPWELMGRSLFGDSIPPREAKVALPMGPEGRNDPERRFSTEALARSRAETVARIHQRFGPGVAGLYQAVPGNDPLLRGLLGRELASFDGASDAAVALETPRSPTVAEVPGAAWLEAVDPRSGAVPTHVIGRFPPESGPLPRDVAVALNGRIEAVTRTYPDPSGWGDGFTALLPEDAIRDRNQLEIFEIERGAARLRLVRTSILR